MGRRRKDNEPNTEQVKRRSSRLSNRVEEAPPPKTSPAKQTPRSKKKKPVEEDTSDTEHLNDSTVANPDMDTSNADPSDKSVTEEPEVADAPKVLSPAGAKRPIEDKQATDADAKRQKADTEVKQAVFSVATPVIHTSPAKSDDAASLDNFVHVAKDDLPAPDSAEVASVVKAQGEDGQLLVGFVQVAKDEVPAADSAEVSKACPIPISPKPVVSNTASLCGDTHTSPFKTVPATIASQNNASVFNNGTPVPPTNAITAPFDSSATSLATNGSNGPATADTQ